MNATARVVGRFELLQNSSGGRQTPHVKYSLRAAGCGLLRMTTPESAVILLVEDREDDVFLIKKAFARAGLNNPLYIVSNGEEAIAYLLGGYPFSNRNEYPLPDLILLDLKMPKLDGFETLQWIRKQPGIRGLPVVVLTSSEEIRDVNRAYQLGANSFLVKPLDFENSVAVAKMVEKYWLRSSKLPETYRPAPQPSPLRPPQKL
jgi:CheY-like chemotaxis protein